MRNLSLAAARLPNRYRNMWKGDDLAFQPRQASNGLPQLFPLQFHLTDRCNLRCIHCYDEGQARAEMNTDDVCRTLDRFFHFLVSQRVAGSVALTGGEPFIREDLGTILDYVAERYWRQGYPFEVSFLTNGTLTNEVAFSLLEHHRGMIRDIQVSIDGGLPATHDRIRGRGTYESAIQTIRELRHRGFAVAIHFVISRVNAHELESLVATAQHLDVGRVTISRLVPSGERGKAMQDQMLTPQELAHAWAQANVLAEHLIDQALLGTNRTVIARQRCDLWHLVDPEYAERSWQTSQLPVYLLLGQRCPVGVAGLTVLPDGTVLPCRRFPIPLGNILNLSMEEIWYGSPLLWEFRNRQKYMKGKCLKCRYLLDPALNVLCNGGAPCIAYAVSGDCHVPDPQCWYQPESMDMTR